MSLAGRKILVTGASHGIGRAISEALLAANARVVGLGRDFGDWPTPPPELETLALDLQDLDALPDRLQQLAQRNTDLDGLICNAGAGRFGALEEFSYRQIRQTLDLNLVQHVLVTRALLPQLKRRPLSDLIFIGSEAGLDGGPRGAVYSAAKAGLRGLAQSLRKDCASAGLRVCTINPGMVETGFYNRLNFRPGAEPSQHLRPADIAAAVVMVLSAPPGSVFDEINLSPLKKVLRFSKRGP